MGTTNILDLNNRVGALEKKEDQDTTDYEKLSNLPKINSVELSGNKTTSDIGINATNVMLSDSVTSVEDALDEVKSGLVELGDTDVVFPLTNPDVQDGTTIQVDLSVYRYVLIAMCSDNGSTIYGSTLMPVSLVTSGTVTQINNYATTSEVDFKFTSNSVQIYGRTNAQGVVYGIK